MVHDACTVSATRAMSDAELWHARFGHLNFGNLLRLKRQDMVSELP
ncbi:hypothetical protein HX126_23540 [Chryseobacterium indologenes]|nr:hypothetical protein [Chryseobacterium indologenes]